MINYLSVHAYVVYINKKKARIYSQSFIIFYTMFFFNIKT
jgi:hypothetical protein